MYYDEINQSDIIDLRNSSKKVEDYNRLIGREFNKLVAGTNRGKEGEWKILFSTENFGATSYEEGLTGSGNTYIKDATITSQVSWLPSFNTKDYYAKYSGYIFNDSGVPVKIIMAYYSAGLTIVVQGDQRGSFSTGAKKLAIVGETTRTKSNTLLHCDIIGNPTNYPTAWKQNGVFGTPLIVAEDGTSLLPDGTKDIFKLSRKANATPLLCLRSTDSGATWTSFTPTFNTITNEITLINEPAANLVVVYYQTHTLMAVPTVNSEVLAIGDVIGANGYTTATGLASVANSLIGKTMTSSTVDATYGYWTTMKFSQSPSIDSSTKLLANSTRDSYYGKHPNIYLYGSASPACKVFPYLTRLNGKAYLNLVFKEMKHNGTSWGDDSKFNIVDNVSTTTDNNAQTVLIGQKTVELPYFIGADE